VQVNALQGTGSEVRLNLKQGKAKVVLRTSGGPGVVEIYQGSFLVGWDLVGPEGREIVVSPPGGLDELRRLTEERHLPFDAGLSRVMLPWRPPSQIVAIEGDIEPGRPEQAPARRYLAYGSSITHGSVSVRPSGMWAHRASQLLGADLINLGFGGGAHLEGGMADYIAARDDWHFATLEMGINLIGQIDAEEFRRRVDYFVETVARAHREEWVFCIDLFTCGRDYARDAKVAAFREIVRHKVRSLNLPRLVHLPGTDILTSPQGLTVDLVHPSPYGMEEMGRNVARLIREAMA
jgi:lysophospholipase L1-like esterase